VVVCYFLTVFTLITLFLSLSLALHDQHLRINKQSVSVFSRDVEPARASVESTAVSPVASVKIFFAQGSAAVEVLDAEAPVEENADSDDPPERPEVKRKRLNRENLEKLTGQIVSLAGKDHLRVVLAGHSDDQPVDRSSPYKSNFELSQARIHQVIVNLLARLDRQPAREWRRNIEWLLLPCANEQGFLDGNERRRQIERLSVEVLLLPSDGDRYSNALQPAGKALRLLDYLYYGVYTITTTGNGDIVPVSAYAKFLTTVANFFAIFLLAVFFNVLLSFLRDEPAQGA
jgi:Ion channel